MQKVVNSHFFLVALLKITLHWRYPELEHKQQWAQGPWPSAWPLARSEQVRFMPNTHVSTSYIAEVSDPNFDI